MTGLSIFARRVVDFLLFTSVFVALCAIGMIWQTYELFKVAPYSDYLSFVFFGCLCSYNFHWYLTPQIYSHSYKTRWSVKNKNLHLFLFALGLILAAWFCMKLLPYWKWLLVTALVAFLHSAPKLPFPVFKSLKKIAVGKTIFLSLVWTHSTVILPLVISDTAWYLPHYLFVVNRFFLIYSICILFDYRDKEEDKKEGIKSLITYLPDDGISRLYIASLVVFFITGGALYVAGFSGVTTLALITPGIVLALWFSYFKRATSDYLYYFLLDGLMVLSALLVFLIRF